MPRPTPKRRATRQQYATLPEILSAYQRCDITFAQASDAIVHCFADRNGDPIGNPPFPYALHCLACNAAFTSVIHPLVNTECCSDHCLAYMLDQNYGAYALRIAENHKLLAVIVTELLVAPSLDVSVLLGQTTGHPDLIYSHVLLDAGLKR